MCLSGLIGGLCGDGFDLGSGEGSGGGGGGGGGRNLGTSGPDKLYNLITYITKTRKYFKNHTL